MSKKQVLAMQSRKLAVSFLVLMVFLFPAFVTARWAHGVFASRDPRGVFSSAQLESFVDSRYENNLADAPDPYTGPLITITFDDGWESVYSEGLPIVEKYGIDTTQYILGGRFDDYMYLSEAQVKSMQMQGHEIGSHTMTHPNLTTLASANLAQELGQSKKILTDKFGQTRDFASPLGATNDLVMRNIKKHYRSHRNTDADPKTVGDEDINVAATFDRYNINAYTVRDTTTLDDLKRLINHTIKRNGWLILTYHQIDDSGSQYAVTPEALDAQLRLVRDSGLRAPTMGQVLDAIDSGRQENAQ